MSLNRYRTTIDLFQIGSEEQKEPLVIEEDLEAKDFDHLHEVTAKFLHKRFGVNYVEFFYSGENLSIQY